MGALVLALGHCTAAFAANPWLHRKDVRWLPQHVVPFESSAWRINQGQKQPDGSCAFPLDDIAVDPPEASFRRITVQRAVDDARCAELLEYGWVHASKFAD